MNARTMSKRTVSRLAAAVAALGTLMLPTFGAGGTMTWDTSVAADATITDGAGAWTTNSGAFNNGAVSVAWTNTANSGDTAKFGGGSSGTAGTVTITGTVTPAGLSFVPPFAGTYTLSGGTNALQGAAPTVTFTTNATINSVLTTAAGSVLTFSGANVALNSLNLGRVGSIGGTVTINGTYLLLNLNGNTNSLAGATTITVGSTNTLRYAGTLFDVPAATSFNLAGAGAGSNRGALSFYNTGITTISGNITLSGNTVIATRSAGLTFAGNIGESGGARSLTLGCDFYSTTTTPSGNNTFSGGLTILNPSTADGVATKIIAGRDTAFGTGPLTLGSTVFGTSTVTVDLNGKAIAIGGLSGGAFKYFIQSDNGAATLTVTNSAANTFSGIIRDGAGSVALTKGNTGTLTLSGTNTFTGATTIGNGVLKLGIANAITNTGTINVAGGTYNLGGFTVTNGAVSLSAGTISNGTLWTSALTIAGTGGIQRAFVAELKGGGLVTNSVLTVNSALNLTNGVAEAVVIGTNLTLAANAALNYDFTSTTADVVNVTGTLTLLGANSVNLTAISSANPPSRITLFTFGSPLVGGANLSDWTAQGAGLAGYKISVKSDANSIYISLARKGMMIGVL